MREKFTPEEKKVLQTLEALRVVPERRAESHARGKEAFLAEARRMKSEGIPVSPAPVARLTVWNRLFGTKKEVFRMSPLVTLMLIVSLLFGGTGVTAVAAQNSLPDEPLYPVKLLTEQVRTELTTREQAQLALMLELANRRAEEANRLMAMGKAPSEALLARWQTHLEQATRLALQLGDEEARQALLRVQETLRQQMQWASSTASPARVREMLQEQQRLVEQGIAEPEQLRQRLRQNAPMQTAEPGENRNPWTDETPTPGSGYGPGPGTGDCTTCTPTGGGSQNPWTDETPTPGSGYGPGPGTGDCTTCTPTGGGSQNPWTDGTPTPGSGYGPGPGNESGGNRKP
ncbi:DUF5667 domain-containing protein [Anaerolinea thermophila]|uniref:DUF5667 domain-containing protein n=1 Tax=Anaerolinea thermophila (strain DSM 14523 / JCM 11388 / NBRC 100420 / UNI-1) TaxID=926569 RepID=E8MYG4_ANATU|nr:DUF5667 domain-containing protein [Anaerolinea thermophila]BAJ62109.1 hypothetical protein ANT_00750 [Anaerolinea thermophila UNI-1]